ncbi:MAG: pyruvate dehydrogenase complex dihydrolipoamide acetyltransferase [Hyphomicrobiales bacterium]|nr:pyruvate dehydrogenase complex dihydrolipoamide acetyltransferase [Hyphomicrobiales bacterium]
MPINILMPALSPTMEEGKLAKWMVKEGDTVSSGDVIAEIETDKATMEVEAIDEGTVGKILIPEGTDAVKVNELIAVLLEDGEDASAIDVSGGSSAPAPAAEAARAPAADTPAATVSAPPPAPSPVPAANGSAGPRVFASPLAKRLAKQSGLDLSALKGSGPHGRIVKRDIEKALSEGTGKTAPAPAAQAPAAGPAPAAPQAMPVEQVMKLFEEGTYEVVPHDNMRKVIAKRLTEAKSTIPHFYLTVDCELDALLALRKQVNEAAPVKDEKPAYKVSVNDMIIKALALALQAVPDANATWTESGMLLHKHSDVGVAVAIPGGLITPVVRKAEQKGLAAIANEMKDFAKRARERKLLPHEYQGGSTAVSNLGMFGIRDFSAVINPPHATILAVGAGEQRPVVKDGALQTATIMTVTLSTDHRAVDGALGAELLSAFKQLIENPMGMLV